LGVAVNDIQKTLPECGAGEALSQIHKVTDIASCLKDIQQAVQIAQQIEADVKAKDISSFINDAVALVNIAKQAVSDCKIWKKIESRHNTKFK